MDLAEFFAASAGPAMKPASSAAPATTARRAPRASLLDPIRSAARRFAGQGGQLRICRSITKMDLLLYRDQPIRDLTCGKAAAVNGDLRIRLHLSNTFRKNMIGRSFLSCMAAF